MTETAPPHTANLDRYDKRLVPRMPSGHFLLTCRECGAAVTDDETHSRWHGWDDYTPSLRMTTLPESRTLAATYTACAAFGFFGALWVLWVLERRKQ